MLNSLVGNKIKYNDKEYMVNKIEQNNNRVLLFVKSSNEYDLTTKIDITKDEANKLMPM